LSPENWINVVDAVNPTKVQCFACRTWLAGVTSGATRSAFGARIRTNWGQPLSTSIRPTFQVQCFSILTPYITYADAKNIIRQLHKLKNSSGIQAKFR